MSLKNRPITRRTVLRGVGTMVGLPLLEAMRPAARALAATSAAPGAAVEQPPVRMACLFWPNGCNPRAWTPEGEGKDFTLFALVDGQVKYEWKSNDKQKCSVYPAAAATSPA